MEQRRHLFRSSIVAVTSVLTFAGCSTSPRNPQNQASSTWVGLGIVTGLNGHGDGPAFVPLIRILRASKDYDGIKPIDAAVVSVTATVQPNDTVARVHVSNMGPCEDLRDGYLSETKLFLPDSKKNWIAAGKIVTDPNLNYSGHIDNFKISIN